MRIKRIILFVKYLFSMFYDNFSCFIHSQFNNFDLELSLQPILVGNINLKPI